MQLNTNNIDPLISYQWLITNEPKTVEDLQVWKDLAESILIYCDVPTYTKLTNIHRQKLQQLSIQYQISLNNHLSQFNNDIQKGI